MITDRRDREPAGTRLEAFRGSRFSTASLSQTLFSEDPVRNWLKEPRTASKIAAVAAIAVGSTAYFAWPADGTGAAAEHAAEAPAAPEHSAADGKLLEGVSPETMLIGTCGPGCDGNH